MSAMRWILVLGGIVLAGCGGRDAGEQNDAGEAQGMAGMKMDSNGMGGHMGMEGMSMMPMMRGHMDSMMRMSPAQMSQMMALHEGMMSQMMDGMGAEMRRMSMGGTPSGAP